MEILHWKLSIAPKGCRTPPAKKLDPAWCSPKMQTLCSFLFSLPRVTFAFKLEFEIIEKDKLPRAQLSGARFILASSSSGFSFEQLFPPGFRDLFERQEARSKRRKTSDQAARPSFERLSAHSRRRILSEGEFFIIITRDFSRRRKLTGALSALDEKVSWETFLKLFRQESCKHDSSFKNFTIRITICSSIGVETWKWVANWCVSGRETLPLTSWKLLKGRTEIQL